ncbi:MAG: hypothetical protein II982_04390, partial [Clostridia bacterium]|nr:hypothetical protein [Clostridia bacterium]
TKTFELLSLCINILKSKFTAGFAEFNNSCLCRIDTKFFDCLFEKIPAARYRLEVEPENERAVKLYKEKGFYYLPYQQMIKGN